MAARILIVDDDPAECSHLERIVNGLGHLTEVVASGEAALARLARTEAPPISAMILDLIMPDLDGMAVLERLQREASTIPVIVQTAAGRSDAAGSAMRLGAFDFLMKPASAERLRASLANALRLGALEGEVVRMRRSRAGTLAFSDIVIDTPGMERVLRLAERAARGLSPILIEGERGVGKEFLARAIHGSSVRRGRPFVMLRCEGLGAAELAGALCCGDGTADGRRRARPADTAVGTLYLDQIGALAPSAQEKLASILKTKDVEGGHGSQRGDVRLIAAASEPLIDRVSAGNFREDLFYRLSVTPIWLPPLRDRRDEIPQLARGIVARLAAEEGRSAIAGLSAAASTLLSGYDWPGNFRELENAVFRAVMLCEACELSPSDFPQIAVRTGSRVAERNLVATQGVPTNGATAGVAHQEQVGSEAPVPAAAFADTRTVARYGIARLLDESGEMRPFEALEEEMIRFAIDHYRGHMSKVARRLGIGRSTLYRKIRDYGIASEEPLLP